MAYNSYMILIEGNNNYFDPNNGYEVTEGKINHAPGIKDKNEQKCMDPEVLARMLNRVKRNYLQESFPLTKIQPLQQKRFQIYQRHILGHLKK